MKVVPVSFVCLLVLCAACESGTTGGANSNTNWLQQCERDADCEGSWDCLCGVCTSACDDGCEAQGGACIEQSTLAHSLQCGDEEAALCLRGCERDGAQCEAGELCVNGACSARPSIGGCDAHPDALFCSSFEGVGLEAATLVDGGELAQSAALTLSGRGALAAAVEGDNQRSRARYDFDMQDGGSLYLRAWLYFDMEDSSEAHVHTLSLGSVDTPMHGSNVHVQDGMLGLTFNATGDVAGEQAVPARTWFCMRAEITLGAEDGAARVFLNEALSAEVDGADTLPPDGVHNLAVGIDHTPQPGTRILVDDVLLATEPVECTR